MRTRKEMIKLFIDDHQESIGIQKITSLINGIFLTLLDIRDLLSKPKDSPPTTENS